MKARLVCTIYQKPGESIDSYKRRCSSAMVYAATRPNEVAVGRMIEIKPGVYQESCIFGLAWGDTPPAKCSIVAYSTPQRSGVHAC